MKFSVVAAGAVLAFAGLSASASETAWGIHDAAESVAMRYPTNTTFDDVYSFTLGQASSLLAVAVSNDALSVFNIEGGQVSLFKDTDGNFTNDTALSSFAFDQAATFKQWSALAAGDYYYRIAGTVTGTQGGTYVLSSALMPIPEPETYALLLAGLGAVAFVSRRRKSS